MTMLKKLPDKFLSACPTAIATPDGLRDAFRSMGLTKGATLMAATPRTSGLHVAIKYNSDDFEFQNATVLDKKTPAVVTDHVLAFRIPTVLKSYKDSPHVVEALGIDDASAVYVIAQVCLPRQNLPTIKEKLPRVQGVAGLTRMYLTGGKSPNLRTANLLKLVATDVVVERNNKLERIQVPVMHYQQHLVGLGFDAYNTHFTAAVPTACAKELRKKMPSFQEHLQRLNSSYKITGLRILPNSPTPSSFNTFVWKT